MKKIVKTVIILILIAVICIGGFLVFQGYGMYKEVVESESIVLTLEEIRNNPNYVTMDQLPQMYIDAVISAEDRRFMKHGGIDPIAIGRALWNDLRAKSFVEGGSTITQQLAKNQFFTQDKVVERKVAEVFMAFNIEKNFTKEEIFEMYVNSIYFGNGYYGIWDACQGYYNKEPIEMTDYESTMLAGIPNAPSAYALTANPELASQRQKQVLGKMVERKYLTEDEADQILRSQ